MGKFDLTGKSAVITGGASGIGKAITETFAFAGASVHILELNMNDAQHVVEEIKKAGFKAQAYSCNVANKDETMDVFKKINSLGVIDILVNNAGVAHVGNIEGTTEQDMDRLYNINIKGVYNCMLGVIPSMKENKGGVILNMASIASTVGIADRFAYSMTKGAVFTMTLSVAKDYLSAGIRCNSISPARVHTPFVDGFVNKNYPGKEKEMLDKLSKSQPIGRMVNQKK